MSDLIVCERCGKEVHGNGFTTGYGIDAEGHKNCFACCGELDSKRMATEERITLYLSKQEGAWYVENWPGSLKFRATVSISKRGHFSPLSGYMERRDAHFVDHHGTVWHGRSIGDNTQLCHCRKIKSKRAIEHALWWLNPIWNMDGTKADALYIYDAESGKVVSNSL